MHWKKYAILTPPFLLIGIFLIAFLPIEQRYYAFIVVLIFWVFYYAWVLIEKKRKKDDIENTP
ncbi:hypothetical protein [Ornithinibacillus halophilus]|uniref:Uncharacterized protein n=1 Tax=Ornithinibacillus halophilus TaxID=930117 RepID=A0A1M5G4Z4_9BACI|nr:hypothetical protein [Ornithinibacillus halophilus]SHF98803.1 hypothetical protein SAMN05216225_101170 [Ornithinibacillus halophilus]